MIKVSVTHPVRRLGQLDMAVGRTPSGGAHLCWSITLGLVVVEELLEIIPVQEAILRRARGCAASQRSGTARAIRRETLSRILGRPIAARAW